VLFFLCSEVTRAVLSSLGKVEVHVVKELLTSLVNGFTRAGLPSLRTFAGILSISVAFFILSLSICFEMKFSETGLKSKLKSGDLYCTIVLILGWLASTGTESVPMFCATFTKMLLKYQKLEIGH